VSKNVVKKNVNASNKGKVNGKKRKRSDEEESEFYDSEEEVSSSKSDTNEDDSYSHASTTGVRNGKRDGSSKNQILNSSNKRNDKLKGKIVEMENKSDKKNGAAINDYQQSANVRRSSRRQNP
jgi:hypothetical protein